MRIDSFEWDEANIAHIAGHNVTPYEVEEACYLRPFSMKARDGRYLILGRSESGRYLAIVAEYKGRGAIRVITARDMDQSERRRYNQER